ncbi:DNA primase [Segniliparus rotundus DSM 44985]|uniref:DNA primase n=1 Tax=Segniliparus rotundus (strain ATCC BAA-972 / CDC 1076 / CIP 108378 / DSM 44985 / JCM 13578) TaxID=640132 RepID=D6Z8J5_SEGRD|nr:DNA primase [Segniliparus rotundus]ADG98275.1 DNA primase [Segniliparus rotundus DSM 44985]
MIAPADIEAIRERASIAEVVGDYVSLRPSGHDRMVGLCPFHDERTPSFQVTPSRGFYHCFGCGEGGDIYRFLQNIEHVSFVDAVEILADRIKYQLTRTDDSVDRAQDRGTKRRLISANQAAAEFYASRLMGEEAAPARDFLKGRGFDREISERFGCGFAPRGWDHLVRHMRAKGFAESELEEAGLARKGQRGMVDRFRGRLLWPIRNASREVIGFGARRIFEDDDGPKYLNTPETKLYKKSHVLFGLDQAKREIATKHQVVVVEGYTDVMAMHAAGVPTAVASCGTAFGADHIAVIRRLLLDDEHSRGEVIYTFDGDEAGKAAALKAWEGDQSLVARTFVALMPAGLDPCDTRLQQGDDALRGLVAQRVPLLEFATRAALAEFDLANAEGRVGALRRTVPMVAKIKDVALRDEYARQLAGWVGWDDTAQVLSRVREEAGEAPARRAGGAPAPSRRRPSSTRDWSQRESLKALLQHPKLIAEQFAGVSPEVFAREDYRAIRDAALRAMDAAAGLEGQSWVQAVRDQADDERLQKLVAELAVEPIATSQSQMAKYVGAVLARLELFDIEDQIAELKSELSRNEGSADGGRITEVFGELVALESFRRALQKQANGEDSLGLG